MAQEIIDAIRQAEQAAEQREAQAGQQAEEIIAEARSGAAAQKSELIRQAREKPYRRKTPPRPRRTVLWRTPNRRKALSLSHCEAR